MKYADIHRTDNYKLFRHLTGNRSVKELRIKRIMRSIEDNGYILSPLCVNERMEVIDGQGRLEALKRLSLPVDYYIVKGAGERECIAMNLNQENWKTVDFIDSYAELGNDSYVYLKKAMDTHKTIPTEVIIATLYGSHSGQISKTIVKDGSFVCTDKQYREGIKCLDWLAVAKPFVDKIGGRRELLYHALTFCWESDVVDNDRLLQKMDRYISLFEPIATSEQAYRYIETVYNYRSSNKVYIYTEYRKYCDECCKKAGEAGRKAQHGK